MNETPGGKRQPAGISLKSGELVDGSEDLVAVQRRNHPLDLPPMAETGDISVSAAAMSTRGRFKNGVSPEALHQLGGVGQSGTAVDEGRVHGHSLTKPPFPDCRQMSSMRH
jgi:hypothetical protein